jgi:hypothetical protein
MKIDIEVPGLAPERTQRALASAVNRTGDAQLGRTLAEEMGTGVGRVRDYIEVTSRATPGDVEYVIAFRDWALPIVGVRRAPPAILSRPPKKSARPPTTATRPRWSSQSASPDLSHPCLNWRLPPAATEWMRMSPIFCE